MRAFLRRNWLWILLPIALVAAGLAALLLVDGGSGSGFIYPLF